VEQSATDGTPPSPKPLAGVPAVVKAIWIVRYLNASAPLGVSLAELSAQGKITRSHCHGIMQTLAAHDWVSYDPARREYKLKTQLSLDTASLLNAPIPLDEIRSLLTRLAQQMGVNCILSRVEPDSSFLVVDTIEGGNHVGISVPIGHRFPPDAPVQCKAAHAWSTPEEIDAWLDSWQPTPYTRNTVTTRARMKAEFKDTRRRGYAISVGEYTEGILSIGLPIFDSRGRIILIVQVPGVRDKMTPRLEVLTTALIAVVADIHHRIGGRRPT
jgi:DNA-binding IclR family transcriptional regulator